MTRQVSDIDRINEELKEHQRPKYSEPYEVQIPGRGTLRTFATFSLARKFALGLEENAIIVDVRNQHCWNVRSQGR